MDCNQLQALKLSDKEAEYCSTTLSQAVDSPNLSADGFAVHELLNILINLTSSYSAVKRFILIQSGGGKGQRKPGELSSFDQQMLKAADELERNSGMLVHHGLLKVIEKLQTFEQFGVSVSRLLWNLLHSDAVKAVVKSDFPNMIELLKSQYIAPSSSSHEMNMRCCLWQLEATGNGKCRSNNSDVEELTLF